jgi:hypothetical protein
MIRLALAACIAALALPAYAAPPEDPARPIQALTITTTCQPLPAAITALKAQGFILMGAGADRDGDIVMLWVAPGSRHFLVTILLADGRLCGISQGDGWQVKSMGNPT